MNEHCNEVDSTEESLPLPDDFRKVLEMKNVIFLLADEVERLARISSKDCGGFDDAGGFEHLFDNCLMRFDRTESTKRRYVMHWSAWFNHYLVPILFESVTYWADSHPSRIS